MPGFTASYHWLLHFKRCHHILSRRVNKINKKESSRRSQKILKTAESFVKLVNSIVPNYPADHISNNDQSSFK